MKCSKCGIENQASRKFCRECGAKLSIICPSCQTENVPGDKFCGECGLCLKEAFESPLQEVAFDEKLKKIQRYLPQGLTEKILAQKHKIEGERKPVTVMFCDMVGFTGLSEKIGPEDAYSIMDRVYEILIHKVHEFGGTVNEMTGDGVLALFGAPVSIEDAPQRAIRVAMAIHREMARFNDRLKQEQAGLPVLKMRAGIHTGSVVVGTLGNDLRVEFKAVGDTVNLASRMENMAEAGATYITEDTFKLTEGMFRFEALGEKQVKGRKDPIKVYRVISTSSRRTRFDVSAERGLTPFVGRERELELLLDGLDRATVGRGQAFSIMAEAGVGKSRLLYEFRKAVSNEDITFLEGKCLSYSHSVAYHPVIDILKSNFNILDTDSDEKIREKVIQGLKSIGVDAISPIPYLLELLGVKDSGIDQLDMSPEAIKDRIMSTVNLIPLKGSEIRPLVMAVEDLHWIDKSSEACFKLLLESISGARIFLIFTYRPEYVHTWGSKSYHSQINLNRLSNRETLAMLAHFLGTPEIDKEIEELVLEKTEGVPFFIEEFIRTLKDLKIIESSEKQYHLVKDIQNVTIPSTIQEVIMSRVDSLQEGPKELLQVGSIIDREFSYELIQKVSALPERELLSRLSVLKDTELIYERGIYPQSTYIFKHALTQEVVYESILRKRKTHLHEKIGSAMEMVYKENIEDYLEVLAEHFIKAQNFEKGAQYSNRITKKAEKTASFQTAIAYSEKRIACLESLPRTHEIQKKIIDARTVAGLYMVQINYHAKAKKTVTPIIDPATDLDYKNRLCQIYTIIGSYDMFVEDDLPKAFQHLDAALKISQEVDDIVSAFFANFFMGNAFSFNCEFKKALHYLYKAFDFTKAANFKWSMAAVKSYLVFFGYLDQGKIDFSYNLSSEALKLAEESGDIYSKATVNTVYGVVCYGKRDLDAALRHLLKGADVCERFDLFAWTGVAQMGLGQIYYEIEDYEMAKQHFKKAYQITQKGEFSSSFLRLNKINFARAQVKNNEKNIDVEMIRSFASENKVKKYDGCVRRYTAEVLLNIDDNYLSEADDWIRQAIEADQRNGMHFQLGKDYALYAELFKKKKGIVRARENLDIAIDIFKECGADGWAQKYKNQRAAM